MDLCKLQLESTVAWLAAHAPSTPDLKLRPLTETVEEFLSLHFYQPVYLNLAERKKQGLLELVCI